MVEDKMKNESEKRKKTDDSNEVKVEIKSPEKPEYPKPEDVKQVDDTQDNGSESVKSDPEPKVIDPKKKVEELEDRLLRLSAEFDNYKKRTARQYEDMIKLSNINIISQLLEVIDNFERALEAASNTDDKEALKKGAELINQQLLDILKKENVEVIKAVGEQFDPNLHEAMMQAESDEHPEGVIISEMIKGYKLKDKVVRYSKVVVSKGQSGKNDEDESNEE